jgi:hypothetical protein
MRTVLCLLFALVACSKSDPVADFLTQSKDNPVGTWTATTSNRASYQFTVTSERQEHGGANYFKASGTVDTMDLRGFLVTSDSKAPAGATVLWLRDTGGGNLDAESNKLISVTSTELVMGGDAADETSETGRLKRN